MRFDDRLSTVLAGDIPAGTAAVAQYRQLVDILGQISGDEVDERLAPALARVHGLRRAVSDADRLLTVQCLSGRLVSPVLVQYLAAETPSVASAAIRAARLSDEQWAALVPALPTRARGFLRHRRDLGPRTRTLLDQLGLYDTALPDAVSVAAPAINPPAQAHAAAEDPVLILSEAEAVPPALLQDDPEHVPAIDMPAPDAGRDGPQSIGEIVKRIEALQEVRFKQAMEERPDGAALGWQALDEAMQPPAPEAPAQPPASAEHEHFRFTTGVDGAITGVTGIALGSVYGLSIALPAMAGIRGVDAAVATAFSRRMPIRGGRADLGNAAGLAGEWRIDADPGFDRASGRFIGYRGMVRRPMAWESAGPESDAAGLAGRDGLRQIVHELRTPLNAIMGFSEIIEQQLFGPVAAEYRDMAERIRQDARQLLTGFDDLDTALRLDRKAIDDPAGTIGLQDIVDRLAARVQPLLDHSGATVAVGPLPGQATIAMSHQALDRIVPRLAGALIGSCAPGEVLTIGFAEHGDAVDMRFSRPQSLAGLDEDSLFDVDRADTGQGAAGPLLGLGFCLRLVRNLLASHGGQLTVLDDALCLTLPGVRTSADLAHS